MMNNSRGSAILIALGLGAVLMIIIGGVYTFSSYRIQNTITESQSLKALAIAEAGISCAIAELSQNTGFRTHKVKRDLTWETEENNTQTLENKTSAPFNFSVNSASKGSYSGKLGEGEFKVRVGMIPYVDITATQNIDERFCFFKVESMGKVGSMIRCVSTIFQRRFPAREFLMYDGDFLSLVFGEPNKSNVNRFSVGRLYGHNGLEIGQILNQGHVAAIPGTKQALYNMDLISSGMGGIFIYNPTDISFRDDPTKTIQVKSVNANGTPFSFPLSGTYSSADAEQHGEYPKELRDGPFPLISPAETNYIRDKDHKANSIPPTSINFADYKKQAQSGGLFISADSDYPMPPGWVKNSIRVKVLDFGNKITPNSTPPNPANGVIYSDDDIVIRGNPPRDMKIVSAKNIFVAGDFNQAGDPANTKEERYGFPQYYGNNNPMDVEDYDKSVADLLKNDKTATGFTHHKAVSVIAAQRVVLDYRSPIDCFENELYPYMKARLAAALVDQTVPTKINLAKKAFLDYNMTSPKVTTDATDGAAVKTNITSFFTEFPLGVAADEDSIKNAFESQFPASKDFDDTLLEQLAKQTWVAYRKNYESNKLSKTYGVYKLLSALQSETVGKTDSPDYLYFPEMTVNAMLISCAKRNSKFYAGPDYLKNFDEIGNKDTNVGVNYSPTEKVIQRIYGAEARYATLDKTDRITQSMYEPMTRRRIYDECLPSLGLDSNGVSKGGPDNEVAVFVMLSWKDTRASQSNYTAF
ncbi:MAG: hypothetical protein HQM09_20440 [Candidatus Riflebacteria bacterium]|nr:hypothetical protein [Candidatus Riflebacteria bacterium]